MSSREPRPVRNLAAWGYQSNTTDTTLEIDVWTVNRVETETQLPDASQLAGGVETVLAVAGNVAKVEYSGAAGTGFQYVDPSQTNDPNDGPYDATQQAFAGASRAAGVARRDDGTLAAGGGSGVVGPSQAACVEHGEREVIPTLRRELRETANRGLAQALEQVAREPSRDEEEEPVETRPFDGFRNVVRILPGTGGDVYRYRVRNGTLRKL